MDRMDEIYVRILHVGFLVLKQAMDARDSDWVREEIEMLHNVPSLIGEANRERHKYYWHQERARYITWMTEHGSEHARSRMRTFYEPLWAALAEVGAYKVS